MNALLRSTIAGLLAAALAAPFAPALAQDVSVFGDLGSQSGEPIKVTADVFEVDRNAHNARFSGHAVVTQGAFELDAPKIDVNYGPGGASDITAIHATGGVRMRFGDQSATGDRADYDPRTQVLTLIGNVTVTGSKGTVKGPKLVVNVAKGTSQFTGSGNSRVTGVFSTTGR